LIYPPGHPYFAETAEEIIAAVEKTTDAELSAFHARHYRSRSLVIAAVGDLDATGTVEDLARRFEPMPPGELEAVSVPAIAPPRARSETVRMEDKVNADVLLAHDSRLRRTDADYLACSLGVAALGQSTLSSRLGLRVRDTEGLTYGINARVSAGRFSGPAVVSMTVAPANLERAVASARSVVEEFIRGGITEKELADEKRSRIGKFKVDLASNAGIAGTLDMAETYGLGVGYLDQLPELVGQISREEVDEAVRRHLRPAELVEVAAGTL
jgi:zinc protease